MLSNMKQLKKLWAYILKFILLKL